MGRALLTGGLAAVRATVANAEEDVIIRTPANTPRNNEIRFIECLS